MLQLVLSSMTSYNTCTVNFYLSALLYLGQLLWTKLTVDWSIMQELGGESKTECQYEMYY